MNHRKTVKRGILVACIGLASLLTYSSSSNSQNINSSYQQESEQHSISNYKLNEKECVVADRHKKVLKFPYAGKLTSSS